MFKFLRGEIWLKRCACVARVVGVLAALENRLDKCRLPILRVGRVFGQKNPVCTNGHASHEGKIPAVAAHDLDNKRALMTGCSTTGRPMLMGLETKKLKTTEVNARDERIARVHDALHGRISANCHGEATHVVIDGPDLVHAVS